jgi:epimerase transport system membrane fusion protein
VNSSLVIPRRIGGIVLLLTFVVFGLWSAIAPLQSAALASGVVVVEGKRKSIEHFEGGIVAQLLVRDGDDVARGDLLIKLDGTQANADLDISTSQYYAYKAREARLKAQQDGLEVIIFSHKVSGVNEFRAQDAMQSQKQIFFADRNARLGEADVLNQKVQQLGEQIIGNNAIKLGKLKLLKSFEEELSDFSKLVKDGYTGKQHLRDLDRNIAGLESEVAEVTSAIARIEVQVGETKLQILQRKKEFHTKVVNEFSATQIELYAIEERMRAAQDRVTRTEIRSPVDGTIMSMAVTTIGESIRPAESLLYVIPQSGELIIEARIKPNDIDRVHKGLSANIRFSSFETSTTPVIDGTIVSVSADVIGDDKKDMPYYLARVKVSSEGRRALNGLTLIPGMPAEVFIKTGSRTLFQYMTQPISNAFARAMIED